MASGYGLESPSPGGARSQGKGLKVNTGLRGLAPRTGFPLNCRTPPLLGANERLPETLVKANTGPLKSAGLGPKSAKARQNTWVFCGYTWKTPGIPGKYPATAWVSCRFPQFCLRFCPRPALRLRETREFPEWSTKHPLFPLTGNAKTKVLGTLSPLFCLPEKLIQANLLLPVGDGGDGF